jgi:hypothetical protein
LVVVCEITTPKEKAPSLQLLPIETRLRAALIVHWRNRPDRWTRVPISVSDQAAVRGGQGGRSFVGAMEQARYRFPGTTARRRTTRLLTAKGRDSRVGAMRCWAPLHPLLRAGDW